MTKQEIAEMLTPAEAPDSYYRMLMRKTRAELIEMLDLKTRPATVAELMAQQARQS